MPQHGLTDYLAGKAGNGGSALRKGLWLAVVGLGFSTLGAATAWKTLTARGLGFYSDEESLGRFSAADADEETRRVEETINNHPMVAELRRRPELTESRPHMKMPAQYRAHTLTGAALLGPRKVPVPATTWTEAGGKSLVSVVYVGEDLCGHPGLVHGGLLATMLDEGLAWCCFGALPHKIGVTANLNVNYRKPTPAGSFLVLRAKTTKVEGRKAWVKGHIELLAKPGEEPTVLVEAEALYVSPKFASVSGPPAPSRNWNVCLADSSCFDTVDDAAYALRGLRRAARFPMTPERALVGPHMD